MLPSVSKSYATARVDHGRADAVGPLLRDRA